MFQGFLPCEFSSLKVGLFAHICRFLLFGAAFSIGKFNIGLVYVLVHGIYRDNDGTLHHLAIFPGSSMGFWGSGAAISHGFTGPLRGMKLPWGKRPAAMEQLDPS